MALSIGVTELIYSRHQRSKGSRVQFMTFEGQKSVSGAPAFKCSGGPLFLYYYRKLLVHRLYTDKKHGVLFNKIRINVPVVLCSFFLLLF